MSATPCQSHANCFDLVPLRLLLCCAVTSRKCAWQLLLAKSVLSNRSADWFLAPENFKTAVISTIKANQAVIEVLAEPALWEERVQDSWEDDEDIHKNQFSDSLAPLSQDNSAVGYLLHAGARQC